MDSTSGSDTLRTQVAWLRRLHETRSARGVNFALGDFFDALSLPELQALEQAAWDAHADTPVARLLAVLIAQLLLAENGSADAEAVAVEFAGFPVKCTQAVLARRGLLRMLERPVCGPTLARCVPAEAALTLPGVTPDPRWRH